MTFRRAASRVGAAAWLATVAGAAGPAHANPCSAHAPTVLTQRFMSASCDACWASPDATDAAVLDWIVPDEDGGPLGDSSIPEAAARAPGLPNGRTLVRTSLLASPSPVVLRVVDGLALNGYIALQLEVTQTTASTTGLTAYMALVDRVAAGRDGTAVDRQRVRAVVGPLTMTDPRSGRRVRHLAAVRVPVAAQAERLAAVAWVEGADGRVVAFVESARAGCR